MIKATPFDTARHLDNPQVISAYLAEALKTRDPRLILRAVRNVTRAGNISKIARATGMSRTSLYWSENASPEFTTVLKVLGVLGVALEPIPSDEWRRPSPRKGRARPPLLSHRTEAGRDRGRGRSH